MRVYQISFSNGTQVRVEADKHKLSKSNFNLYTVDAEGDVLVYWTQHKFITGIEFTPGVRIPARGTPISDAGGQEPVGYDEG
jgi:hypothetical protein